MKNYMIIFVASLLLGCMSVERFEPDAVEDAVVDPVEDDSATDPVEEDAATDPVGDSDPIEDPIEDDPVEEDVEEEEIVNLCSNGELDYGEECDDGNLNDCDGCSSECLREYALSTSGGIGASKVVGWVETGEVWGPCLDEEFTIEAWFSPRDGSITHNQQIVFQHWGYQLGVNTNTDRIIWAIFRDPYTVVRHEVSTPGIIPGNWYHVAITKTSVSGGWSIKTYLDGVMINTSFETGVFSCQGSFYISGPDDLGHHAFNGLIDSVRLSNNIIYTSDFTPSTRYGTESHTQALYSFNSAEGGIITDESGNGWDLELNYGARIVPDECHTP